MAYNDIQRDDRTDDFINELHDPIVFGECSYDAARVLFEVDPGHYRAIQVDLEPIESQDGSLGQESNDLFLARFADKYAPHPHDSWEEKVKDFYLDPENVDYELDDLIEEIKSELESNGYRTEDNDGIEIFED